MNAPRWTRFYADTLIQLSHRVGRMVQKAKDYEHDKQAPARMVSLREIADHLGVSHTAVQNAASELAAAGEISVREPARGPVRQYTLADQIRIREAMGLAKHRGPDQPCVVLGIMNFKGGVAKSTTTAHLTHYLALQGYRVLAIDCDPQATLSTLFGIHPDVQLSTEDTLVPYFIGEQASLDYCIRSTPLPNVSVIPANVGLAEADLQLPARQMRERNAGTSWTYMSSLAEGLKTVEDRFDVVLIDCPPSFSYLTTVATQACSALLVPMRPSMPDFASSAQFMRMFGGFQADADVFLPQPKAYEWIRVLITLGENNNACADMEAVIRKAYEDLVLDDRFPYLAAVAGAAKQMRTIYDIARKEADSRQLAKATLMVDMFCASIEKLILQVREGQVDRAEAQEAA